MPTIKGGFSTANKKQVFQLIKDKNNITEVKPPLKSKPKKVKPKVQATKKKITPKPKPKPKQKKTTKKAKPKPKFIDLAVVQNKQALIIIGKQYKVELKMSMTRTEMEKKIKNAFDKL